MKESVEILLKSTPETRWSGRADAVRVIEKELHSLCTLLQMLPTKLDESPETRRDAQALQNAVLNYEFICNLFFWSRILGQVDLAQKLLQRQDNTLKDALDVLHSLKAALGDFRAELPNTPAVRAKEFCEEWDITIERRGRRKKRMPGEESTDAALSFQDQIVRTQYEVIDRLTQEIDERTQILENIFNKFGQIMNIPQLLAMNPDERAKTCGDFAAFYSRDIDAESLCAEVDDFAYFVKHMESPPSSAKAVLRMCNGAQICPQLHCAMKLMMTIGTSIASCERSFSKLKLLKNFLRARTRQKRLNDLAIISMEKEVAESMSHQELSAKFIDMKFRRV